VAGAGATGLGIREVNLCLLQSTVWPELGLSMASMAENRMVSPNAPPAPLLGADFDWPPRLHPMANGQRQSNKGGRHGRSLQFSPCPLPPNDQWMDATIGHMAEGIPCSFPLLAPPPMRSPAPVSRCAASTVAHATRAPPKLPPLSRTRLRLPIYHGQQSEQVD
jgi:hypothetical protein